MKLTLPTCTLLVMTLMLAACSDNTPVFVPKQVAPPVFQTPPVVVQTPVVTPTPAPGGSTTGSADHPTTPVPVPATTPSPKPVAPPVVVPTPTPKPIIPPGSFIKQKKPDEAAKDKDIKDKSDKH